MDREIDFHGAKVAFFIGEQILVYRRDDNPEIPFPNMLDLPGGGREDGESGAECVARETKEEFGITVQPETLDLVEQYENWRGQGEPALFFVGYLQVEDLDRITFGDEGQGWQTMAAKEFLNSDEAVPHLKNRLQDFLNRQQ